MTGRALPLVHETNRFPPHQAAPSVGSSGSFAHVMGEIDAVGELRNPVTEQELAIARAPLS
jgi:hypothetical protein